MNDFRLGALNVICITAFVVFLPFWVSTLGRWVTPLRRVACWAGWHSPSSMWQPASKSDPTGFLSFARCPWCDHEGQVDSQGNL